MTVQEIQERLAPIVARMAQLTDAECQRLIDSLRFDLETEASFSLEDIPFDPNLRATDELEALILEAKEEIASGMARTIEETCIEVKSDQRFLEKLH